MTNKYLLIPIGILVILLYNFTFILSKLEILKTSTHRKLWNSLLLITFLVTGILGFILAIQVNYKLSISTIDKIMNWHVDFGIGMFFIAIFHLSWHLKYYFSIFKREKSASKTVYKQDKFLYKDCYQVGIDQKNVRISLISLGVITISFQVVMLREFFSVFHGNELLIGVFLCNWMILTALGAYIGKLAPVLRKSDSFISFALIILTILPFVLLFLLYWLKNIVFPSGTMIGLWPIALSSLLLLSPFCIISGFMFTLLACMYSSVVNKNRIDKAYALESFGSMVAGLIISFIFVFFLNGFQILFMVLLFTGFVSLYLNRKIKDKLVHSILSILIILMSLAVYVFDFNHITKQFLYKNQVLLFTKDTPYGTISISEQAGQLNFYDNNRLSYYTLNNIDNEESVHYGLVQHPHPEKVLLLSGGLSSLVPEVKKYDVELIDYVELNAAAVKYSSLINTAPDKENVNIIHKDARLFLKSCTDTFDVILVNLPPPSTAQTNRFYTLEFFQQLNSVMNKQSVVSLSLSPSMNYIGEESVQINSSIYNALNRVFNNVLIIPGDKNYIIASNAEISTSITELINQKGIENTYVNSYYLDDHSIQLRSLFIMSNIDKSVPPNTDFFPVSYWQETKLWLQYFPFNYNIVLVLLIAIVILIMAFLKPLSLGMFTTGFAGASYEVILLFSFQVVYGYVYAVVGVIITLFMAGLALGAILARYWKSVNALRYAFIQSIVGIFGMLIPLLIIASYSFSNSIFLTILFYLSSLLVSVFVGMQFSYSTYLSKRDFAKTSAVIYGADLLGAAIGALFVSAFLIPVVGVLKLSVYIGLLSILSALNTVIRRKTI